MFWKMLKLDLTRSNARSSGIFWPFFFFMAVGAFCVELQHLQIQGCHFLKSALNLDLTLSDDGKCRTFFDSPRNYWFRCFLRRVMVIFRQQKNFGLNVRYCVFGYHFGLSSWSSIDHVTSHSRVVALLNLFVFLLIIRSLYKNKTLREWLVTWYSGPY